MPRIEDQADGNAATRGSCMTPAIHAAPPRSVHVSSSCGSTDDPPSTPPAPRPSPLLSTSAANTTAATTATPRPPTAATVVTPGAAGSVAVAVGVPANTSSSACAPTAAVHALVHLLSFSLPSAPRFRSTIEAAEDYGQVPRKNNQVPNSSGRLLGAAAAREQLICILQSPLL
ncbi:unnamed protein product [Closterium sp. NIES-65]|nr:unnamed protein product [Closterium sp. NIES-65]